MTVLLHVHATDLPLIKGPVDMLGFLEHIMKAYQQEDVGAASVFRKSTLFGSNTKRKCWGTCETSVASILLPSRPCTSGGVSVVG
jgi:hypothetical protein